MQHVDHFIRLRRFENLSLHAVSQGIKVCVSSKTSPFKLTLVAELYGVVDTTSCHSCR